VAATELACATAVAMGDPATTDRVRYHFPPLERRGVIAGWRGGQIGVVAASLVVGVFTLRSRPSIVGVLAALLSVAAGMALAFWPVQGRTGEQWLPLLVRWWWAGSTGTRRQHAPGPGAGLRASVDPDPDPDPGTVRLDAWTSGHRSGRNVFEGVSVVAASAAHDRSSSNRVNGTGDVVGVIIDRPCRTATAVLAVRGHSFALLGPGDQDSRIGAWARVLAGMAREGSEVHRIQWIESCLPDDGSAVRRHWVDHAVTGENSAAGRSYRALIDEAAPVTRRHRVLVALSIHTSRSARSIRSVGGGLAGTGAILVREVEALRRALGAADVTVDGILGPRALARVISEISTSTSGAMDAPPIDDGAVDPHHPPNHHPVAWPWPMAIEPQWDGVRTDATWHTTYWIAEWPRVDVTPDFLGPLLFSPLRRSIVLTMEPVSPSRAARQVAQARTADLADGELRRRGGFLVTARHRREREGVEHRDVELADGHAQYRFSGYVTVTADSEDELVLARGAVEQAAGQAGIELRLLFGEQDSAFACSLPLGRGLS
jgi:hypothetical protein